MTLANFDAIETIRVHSRGRRDPYDKKKKKNQFIFPKNLNGERLWRFYVYYVCFFFFFTKCNRFTAAGSCGKVASDYHKKPLAALFVPKFNYLHFERLLLERTVKTCSTKKNKAPRNKNELICIFSTKKNTTAFYVGFLFHVPGHILRITGRIL